VNLVPCQLTRPRYPPPEGLGVRGWGLGETRQPKPARLLCPFFPNPQPLTPNPWKKMSNLRIAPGRGLPLGAMATPDGVNFAPLRRHATAVTLALYKLDGKELISEIALHPRRNRTGQHWHVLVHGLPPSFCYGWRVDGKHGPGHFYDPSLVLIDP